MAEARAKTPPVKLYEASELPLDARLRLENAGKLVAWSGDFTRIVASGDDAKAVHQAAEQSGERRVIYEWIPPISTRHIPPDA